MRVRLTCVPRRPQDLVEFAVAAEESGLDGLGIADSPALHGATFPVIQYLLGSTRRLRIGPAVTNPVTRHPSVQGADLEALNDLYPSRLFWGIGTGDSAVSSVGLRPATPGKVVTCVDSVRTRVGKDPTLLVAVGGPRVASSVPASASGIIVGGGLGPGWSATLIALAERSAGHRLERWGFLVSSFGQESDAEERTFAVLGSVMTVARHALAGDMAAKGVPTDLEPGLREIFGHYDVGLHGRTSGAHHDLLARHPVHAQYLLDRFAVLSADPSTVSRLRRFASSVGLDGLFLTATVPDQVSHATRIGAELLPALS